MTSARLRAAKKQQAIYHGTPCKYGHDGKRYTGSGTCVQCVKASAGKRNAVIRQLLKGIE